MSDANLPAFVAELESLEAQATPGPWERDEFDIWVKHPAFNHIICEIASDAEFICSLRNHAPAMLALVRQLQGENAALQALATGLANERNKGNE